MLALFIGSVNMGKIWGEVSLLAKSGPASQTVFSEMNLDWICT